jgi:hypothetical protein
MSPIVNEFMDEYPAVKTIFEEALAGIVGCAAIYESR